MTKIEKVEKILDGKGIECKKKIYCGTILEGIITNTDLLIFNERDKLWLFEEISNICEYEWSNFSDESFLKPFTEIKASISADDIDLKMLKKGVS